MKRRIIVGMIVFIPFVWMSALAQESAADLTDLTLEELMEVNVTSASKRSERLFETPAAMYVVTQEDIRRSGASSIPELLRMVPGVQVARIDANKWAVSARGFNGPFANKLLVLIDGRVVYSPLFSGVYWDAQSIPLLDVQRVEVIRGPGATLWGANAVNGVINITTTSARDVSGGVMSAGGNTAAGPFASGRYSAQLDSTLYWKVYATAFNVGHTRLPGGGRATDAWSTVRGGAQINWSASQTTLLTLQGDLYSGKKHQRLRVPALTPPYTLTIDDAMDFSGGNVLARWEETVSPTSSMKLQSYFDRTFRQDALYKEGRNTFDIDFQHGFSPTPSHKIVWGAGYRLTWDKFTPSAFVGIVTPSRSANLANAFVQDEVTLVEQTLFLTVGTKFEYNDYTYLEIQPNARLVLTPSRHHTLWTAVSRAVRTPSRSERDVSIAIAAFPSPLPGLTALVSVDGNQAFRSECLTASELGYRYASSELFSADIAIFYNVYDHLRTAERVGDPTLKYAGTTPYLSIPLKFDNQMKGTTYGGEAALSWHPLDRWKLNVGATLLRGQLQPYATSTDTSSSEEMKNNPQFQCYLRSFLNVTRDLEADALIYFVDTLPNQSMPGYFHVDLRLGWQATSNFALSMTAQNLTRAHHQEFGDTPLGEFAAPIPRAFVGTLTWRF
ncbi:MAG: TonB-dependent receptor [Ignavibacteriae bacterium]|nr:TonB-dependent receptor [Ignavibacteriota bacterium]